MKTKQSTETGDTWTSDSCSSNHVRSLYTLDMACANQPIPKVKPLSVGALRGFGMAASFNRMCLTSLSREGGSRSAMTSVDAKLRNTQ